MAINVQYGPISAAMGLAQQAGSNQGRQMGIQDDMELLGYAQKAQALAQQQRSTEISQAMQGQQLGLEHERNVAQNSLANAQLQSLSSYRNNWNDIRQQNADNNAQRTQNQGDYNQGRLDVSQQNADTRSSAADAMNQYRQIMASAAMQNAGSRQQSVQNQNANTQQRNATAQESADNSGDAHVLDAAQRAVSAHEAAGLPSNDPYYQHARQTVAQIQAAIAGRTRPDGPSVGGSPVNVKNIQPAQQPQQQGQGQPGTQANPIPVTSEADLMRLPPGTFFKGPSGVVRQIPNA